ncbi:MAG: exonuclease SbcCD subunit D [Methanobacteriota archaeon]|nr:MAG: exonuclease SbcCD subunit D [Euryarchaeota archaeon]
MRFVHTSDWHIGYAQYNLEERFSDFFRAAYYFAKEVVNQVKPDFILHSGDIFHHAKPSPGAIRQATAILKIFKNAGIPVFLIRGNHDAKTSKELAYGGTSLKLLSDLGLIEYLDDITVHREDLGVSITGVGHYYGDRAQKRLKEVVDLSNYPPGHFKILAVHNFIEGQLDNVSETISVNLIDSLGFDYVAGGHYHIPWIREKINVWVPGSLETTSANDWRRRDQVNGKISPYATYYIIDAEKDNNNRWKKVVTEGRVLVRPKISIEIETDSIMAEDIQSLIEDEIEKAIKEMVAHVEANDGDFLSRYPNYRKNQLTKPIVRIKSKIELRADEQALLDFERIKDRFNLLKLDFVNEQSDEENYIGTDGTSNIPITEIIKNLAEEIGGKELYPLVQTVIEEFRDRPSSRDFSENELDYFIKQANTIMEENMIEESQTQDAQPSSDKPKNIPSQSVERVGGTLEDWLS